MTGASSGFGLMAEPSLPEAGHGGHASMRVPVGRNAARATELAARSAERSLGLQPLELDVRLRTPSSSRSSNSGWAWRSASG